MPINLHDRVKQKLTPALLSILNQLRVNNRRFLDYFSADGVDDIDSLLPQGEVRKETDRILGEAKISDFAIDHVARMIRSNEYDPAHASAGLNELFSEDELRMAVDDILKNFTTLPLDYIVTLPLPASIGDQIKNAGFQKSPSDHGGAPTLVVVDRAFTERFDLSNDIEPKNLLLGSSGTATITEGAICLQFPISGYFDTYGLSLTASQAEEAIRSFFGIGFALGLFIANHTGGDRGWWSPAEKLIVHKVANDGSVIHDLSFNASREASDLIHRLRLMSDGTTFLSPSSIAWALSQIAKVWSEGDRADQIRRAASWFFDSLTGSNQLLSFIQAMTVIEILVGEHDPDEKGIGLTKLLSNRCAYLLGSTRDEREQILKRFSEIYRVRSQIVHVGKSRLRDSEQMMLFELRSMCRRLIWKEIDLLGPKRDGRDAVVRALTSQ